MCVLSLLLRVLSIIFRRKITTWRVEATLMRRGYSIARYPRGRWRRFTEEDLLRCGGGWRRLSSSAMWTVTRFRVRIFFCSHLLMIARVPGVARGAISYTGAGGAVVYERLAAVSEPLSCRWAVAVELSTGRVHCSEDVTQIYRHPALTYSRAATSTSEAHSHTSTQRHAVHLYVCDSRGALRTQACAS